MAQNPAIVHDQVRESMESGDVKKELVAIRQILQEMLNRIHANDAYAKQMGWK